MTEPRTAAPQYRLAVLDRLIHEDWCDWKMTSECSCDAGQMLISLIATERAEAARAAPLDVEALAQALEHAASRVRSKAVYAADFLQDAEIVRAEYARLATPAEGAE